MIYIETLKKYYSEEKVFITEHAAERFRQRGIHFKEIREAVNNGIIIEQYPDDFPFPSCLVLGYNKQGRPIHICMSDEGTSSRIITVYYPDDTKWDSNYKKRRTEL